MDIFRVNYQIVRVKQDKFFGIRKEWIEEVPVSITDMEKTLVDCLDKPHYAGIIEAAKALNNGSLDYTGLTAYATKIGNFAVIRRLGYLQ